MPTPTAAVLIPSWKRPAALRRCLLALAAQTRRPDRAVVVWQADDDPTRAAAEGLRPALPFRLDVLHSPEAGVVPAENLALGHAAEEVIALIDDDAVAPPGWLARHLAHYADPAVGAVGGPADDYFADGTRFPLHPAEPVGVWTPWGTVIGNMYDQPPEWRSRPPRAVGHLVGYNMTLRRAAFDRFEAGLRRYWQLFELDACLQVRANGYRVLFDFGNVVEHHPTNTAYAGGRDGDLTVKTYNAAYNLGFVSGKHLPVWAWPVAVLRQLLVGRVGTPGLAAGVVTWRRYGHPGREVGVVARTARAYLAGWRAGVARRGARRTPAGAGRP